MLGVLKLNTLFCVTVKFTGPTQVKDLEIPKVPQEELQLTSMP